MKLNEFKYGIVVRRKRDGLLGVLVGLSNNEILAPMEARRDPNNAIFKVEWSSEESGSIHPENVERAW